MAPSHPRGEHGVGLPMTVRRMYGEAGSWSEVTPQDVAEPSVSSCRACALACCVCHPPGAAGCVAAGTSDPRPGRPGVSGWPLPAASPPSSGAPPGTPNGSFCLPGRSFTPVPGLQPRLSCHACPATHCFAQPSPILGQSLHSCAVLPTACTSRRDVAWASLPRPWLRHTLLAKSQLRPGLPQAHPVPEVPAHDLTADILLSVPLLDSWVSCVSCPPGPWGL